MLSKAPCRANHQRSIDQALYNLISSISQSLELDIDIEYDEYLTPPDINHSVGRTLQNNDGLLNNYLTKWK